MENDLNALLAQLLNNPPESTPSADPGQSLEDLAPPPPPSSDINAMLADAATSPPVSTPTPWENPSFPFESTSVSGFDLL